MIRVTTGDALHLYGSVGRSNYSVRLCVRMDENINSEAIVNALKAHKSGIHICACGLRRMTMSTITKKTIYRCAALIQVTI